MEAVERDSPDWRDRATTWLRGLFPDSEVFEIAVHRERAWGSIWKLRVDDGSFWFKRGHPALWREVPLRRILIRRAPDLILPCTADDPEQGWMLTADQGATLATRAREEGTHHYIELARALARVQRSVDAESLTDIGMPMFDPLAAELRLDGRLAWFSGLPTYHPAHVDTATRRSATTTMAGLVDRWERLGSLPALSVDHNDCHAGNAYPGPRISDWGDAVIGHPFGSLRPLLFIARNTFGPDLAADVRRAYLTEWGDPEALNEALDVAMQLAVAQRLLCWQSLDADAMATYAEYITPLFHEVGVPITQVTHP